MAALAVVAAVAAWLLLADSDERRIGKALDRLMAACEKSGPDSAVALLTRNQTIVGAFAPGFLLSAEPYNGTLTDPQEVARLIHVYRASSQTVSVGDSERTIEVRDGGTAEMETVFHVSGQGRGVERFRATLFWVEHEGDWKIRELRIVEVVERGGFAF